MIIIIIILIIIYIYWFWSKKTINQDTDGIQGFKDYKNQRISCNKNIIINDRLEEHISDVNNSAENMNTLHPTGVLPYNLNKTDDYNILNNYGIKNQRKREAYTLKFNGCAIIPHNSQKLLKNYDSVLDESFKTIEIPRGKTTLLHSPIVIKKTHLKYCYYLATVSEMCDLCDGAIPRKIYVIEKYTYTINLIKIQTIIHYYSIIN